MNASAAIARFLARGAGPEARGEDFPSETRFLPLAPRLMPLACRELRAEYCRLLTTLTFLCSAPRALSSMDQLGPIRDAGPGNLAGMHAIGGIFGRNNLGTDAGKYEWSICSVFKEE